MICVRFPFHVVPLMIFVLEDSAREPANGSSIVKGDSLLTVVVACTEFDEVNTRYIVDIETY